MERTTNRATLRVQDAEVGFREEIIDEYLSGGDVLDVLDVGVVDSRRGVESTSSRLEQFSTSLHEHIRRRNPRVTGVDIDEEGVEILRRRGYDVLCRNIENMDLQRSFDLIVAGEVIEHLPNPGLAMSNLRLHLKPEGRLILSTCNPFYARQYFRIWRSGDVQVHDEHTAWFDPHTISRLLQMSGLEVERLVWLKKRGAWSAWKNWRAGFRRYFSPNFLVVAKLQTESEGAEGVALKRFGSDDETLRRPLIERIGGRVRGGSDSAL